MRLWPLCIIDQLPRQQLLGQHRECCALRGRGWGRKHSTVDYVFAHSLKELYEYHMFIMAECIVRRGYKIDSQWLHPSYRGKNCPRAEFPELARWEFNKPGIYEEHNENYLDDCIENLARKGISIDKNRAILRANAA